MFDNGRAALDYLRGRSHPRIDLVLLDVNMPGLSGFEFVEQLSNEATNSPPPCVLLMLTMEPPKHLLVRVQDLACLLGTVEKPLTLDRLIEGTKLLGHPRLKEVM